jgi:hypothetical protein
MYNPIESATIVEFLHKALNELVSILLPIIVLFYIATGLLFITARGDPAKLKLARTALLYISIGAAIVLGAWVITEMVASTIDTVLTP